MRPEEKIQQSIVDYLAAVAPDVFVFAIPNGGARTVTGRASNAVPGLRRGVFDLGVIIPEGGAFGGMTAYIEVKTEKGSLSDPQEEFEAFLLANHVPHMIARSIDDVRRALWLWGVKTREAK